MDTSPTFDRALAVLAEVEGSWSDDPDDAGGLTRWGLSSRFLNRLIQKGRYWRQRLDANRNGRVDPDEMKRLRPADRDRIYRECFWDEYRCGELPEEAATPFFLLVVNARPRAAGRCLQRAILHAGADPGPLDGIVGDSTIAGASEVPGPQLARRLAAEACLLYHRIATGNPTQEKFLRGWFWRVAVSITPNQ